MSVRVGLSNGTSTVWFDASTRWYLRRNGLTVRYGETLDIEAELLARGTPSELRSALTSLRALVATLDRAGGQFLVDDGSAVEAFDVTRAELQDIAERLPFWSQGVARVVLRLTCSPESVSETGTTVAADVSAATGQPVAVDPGGRAELGVRLRATTDVLPAAAIAFALDGTYTASQPAPTLSSPVVQDAETYQTATYTAVARDLDVYVEVDDPPRDTGLGIDRVVAQPPYTVVLALAYPPNTVYGNFRAGDVVIVRGNFPGALAGWKGTLSTRAQVLSADAASILLPDGTQSVVVVRGVTFVDVLDVQARERITTYPGKQFTRNVNVSVPGSAYRVLIGAWDSGAAEYRYPKEGEPPMFVGKWAASQARGVPGSTRLVGGRFAISGHDNVPASFTVTVWVSLLYEPSEFAWCDWWFTGSWAVLQVPSVSSLGGSYRVAVVSYDGSDPVGVVHWPTYVSVPANWNLVVEFSDASPNTTYKVFVQRAGSAQWYATTANPPRAVLSSLGTAESFPSVSATLASDLVTVSVVPSGVVQPRQE
ncbi:MAG: hypothetical protein RMJ05_08030, partial [Thermomicrobium sp.]|nr:hypothetical protein [Thermomicrobium sp.]